MKGNYPTVVYILIAVLGAAILAVSILFNLNLAVAALGVGILAYGANRLIGDWRVRNNPEYAAKIRTEGRDERLAYIADKSRSITLLLTVVLLAVISIVLLSAGMTAYGNLLLYVMCGITFLYFIVYQIIRSRN